MLSLHAPVVESFFFFQLICTSQTATSFCHSDWNAHTCLKNVFFFFQNVTSTRRDRHFTRIHSRLTSVLVRTQQTKPRQSFPEIHTHSLCPWPKQPATSHVYLDLQWEFENPHSGRGPQNRIAKNVALEMVIETGVTLFLTQPAEIWTVCVNQVFVLGMSKETMFLQSNSLFCWSMFIKAIASASVSAGYDAKVLGPPVDK